MTSNRNRSILACFTLALIASFSNALLSRTEHFEKESTIHFSPAAKSFIAVQMRQFSPRLIFTQINENGEFIPKINIIFDSNPQMLSQKAIQQASSLKDRFEPDGPFVTVVEPASPGTYVLRAVFAAPKGELSYSTDENNLKNRVVFQNAGETMLCLHKDTRSFDVVEGEVSVIGRLEKTQTPSVNTQIDTFSSRGASYPCKTSACLEKISTWSSFFFKTPLTQYEKTSISLGVNVEGYITPQKVKTKLRSITNNFDRFKFVKPNLQRATFRSPSYASPNIVREFYSADLKYTVNGDQAKKKRIHI